MATWHDELRLSRRGMLAAVAGGMLVGAAGCEEPPGAARSRGDGGGGSSESHADEEYVWLSANANLPLFTKRDHPALRLAGEELGDVQQLDGGVDGLAEAGEVPDPGAAQAHRQLGEALAQEIIAIGWGGNG